MFSPKRQLSMYAHIHIYIYIYIYIYNIDPYEQGKHDANQNCHYFQLFQSYFTLPLRNDRRRFRTCLKLSSGGCDAVTSGGYCRTQS